MKIASLAAALALCAVPSVVCFAQQYAQGGGKMEMKTTAEDKARLARFEKDYNLAKKLLEKSPNDKKAREHFSSIGALYGHEAMVSPVLDRKVKYKLALHIYREVLRVDPKNPVAKNESEMIVKIYKSLGRPVPKD